MKWPTVAAKASGFLVYADGKLWTAEPVSRDEATRIFNLVADLAPSARVQILGAHTLTKNSQQELSR